MKVSATQVSLKLLRKRGYEVGIVERYNFFIHQRFDLFNVIDLIAIKPGEILGVQATSYGAATQHRQKIREEPKLLAWIEAGGQFELHLARKIKNKWIIQVEKWEDGALRKAST